MSRAVAVLLGMGAGCLVGMQAPINSRLGKTIGTVQAATFSFLVGTVALLAISSLWSGGLGTLGNVGKVPWWALVGGLLGAVYVFAAFAQAPPDAQELKNAISLHQAGDYPGAISGYQRFLKAHPEAAGVRSNLDRGATYASTPRIGLTPWRRAAS